MSWTESFVMRFDGAFSSDCLLTISTLLVFNRPTDPFDRPGGTGWRRMWATTAVTTNITTQSDVQRLEHLNGT